MAAFIYLAGPECGDDPVNYSFGMAFPVGVAVEVTDDSVVERLRRNRFFKEVEAAAPVDDEPVEAERPSRKKAKNGRA